MNEKIEQGIGIGILLVMFICLIIAVISWNNEPIPVINNDAPFVPFVPYSSSVSESNTANYGGMSNSNRGSHSDGGNQLSARGEAELRQMANQIANDPQLSAGWSAAQSRDNALTDLQKQYGYTDAEVERAIKEKVTNSNKKGIDALDDYTPQEIEGILRKNMGR
jgi:hypothetical protein